MYIRRYLPCKIEGFKSKRSKEMFAASCTRKRQYAFRQRVRVQHLMAGGQIFASMVVVGRRKNLLGQNLVVYWRVSA